jgi:hypothetical protein
MSFNLSSNDMPPLLAEPPLYLESDRVKWNGAPRMHLNGELQPRPMLFTAAGCFLFPPTHVYRAGKSFYDEVSVSMSAINDEQACASYGLTPIRSKDALGQDVEL